ncbi:multicopper oxidase domain-containing protein [Novosphingobium sediminicola]|nr:multicopper oxidase domain-containing protein [Novosphingobium sediminicola]
MHFPPMNRRHLLQGSAALALSCVGFAPVAHGATMPATPELAGEEITLRIGQTTIQIDGRPARAVAINGSVPGPTLRLRQGQKLRITVINELTEDTSLHWHGLELPFQMDGVPGVSFPGIPALGRFTYEFAITQHGTYWYHSHSGLQEMMGCYGSIVIEPAAADPAPPAHDHVMVLSDHSFVHPAGILRKLKVDPGHYARYPQTLAGLIAGRDQPLKTRLEFAQMRMDPADISDVTGKVFRYLINGRGMADNFTAPITPGAPTRLRFINAGSMTFFNVRIPDLAMKVIAADGQPMVPVEVDEFQMGPGETYDVIITPQDRAYTVAAEAMDRSGMARATLTPRPGLIAPVPPLRAPVRLTMRDMGMDMDMSHGSGSMDMSMRSQANAPDVKLGPGVDMIAPMPVDRTGDPGLGLDKIGHRVLTYRDLVAPEQNPDPRAPQREIEMHLTGSMDRYLWSFDGVTMSEAHHPVTWTTGERLRITLINDTMMGHPIHLHGHIFELMTGHGDRSPRKHTVIVQPGGKVSFDVTAIEGDWPMHCHLFLHMAMGMMRVVKVRGA